MRIENRQGIENHSVWRRGAMLALVLLTVSVLNPSNISGQSALFREGEKLTYRILFDGYENAGYAELHVVATGKFDGRDVVELRSRFKTTSFVGAALITANESRITYADPSTGLPIFSRLIEDPDAYSRESSVQFASGASSFNLLTAVHALRRQTGRGTIPIVESGTEYPLAFRDGKSERIKTGAGDFDTIISVLESDYFKALGIWEVRVNFSNDSRRIPVEVRLRTKMGKMRISLASLQAGVAERFKEVGMTPTVRDASSSQQSGAVSETVPFSFGERTTLRISRSGRIVGDVILQVGQPVFEGGKTSLPLTAMFNVSPSDDVPFKSGDRFTNKVETTSILPSETIANMSATWESISGRYTYDQVNGTFTREGGERGSMASGTHDLLSFLFALRAFNLVPSSSPTSPINDTRVSVLLGTRNLVFTVRPGQFEALIVNGKSHRAQMLNIVTGDASIDQLSPRIWLGSTKDRPILKITMGDFAVEAI